MIIYFYLSKNLYKYQLNDLNKMLVSNTLQPLPMNTKIIKNAINKINDNFNIKNKTDNDPITQLNTPIRVQNSELTNK